MKCLRCRPLPPPVPPEMQIPVTRTRQRRPSMESAWASTPFTEEAALALGTHALRLGVRYSLPGDGTLTRIFGNGTVQVEFSCKPGSGGRFGPIYWVGVVNPPPHGHVAHFYRVQLLDGAMTAEVGVTDEDPWTPNVPGENRG